MVLLHEYVFHHMIRALTLERGDVDAYLEEHRYGHVPAGYERARRRLAAGLPDGPAGAVRTTGRLDKEAFPAAMTAADIALNLRHPTGGETSVTCVRLLGLGRAVVVDDAGWFAEIPEDCCAKVAVDEREVEPLAAVLEALAADPARRRWLGENARRHAATHHRPESAAQRYAAVVAEAAATRGAAAV